MRLNTVQRIVKDTLPKIKRYYGRSKYKYEYPYIVYEDGNYDRINQRMNRGKDKNERCGEYCWDDNEIIIYYPNMISKKHVVQTLIHEWQHYLQCVNWLDRYYKMGYRYDTHPYEVQASIAEENYKRFM